MKNESEYEKEREYETPENDQAKEEKKDKKKIKTLDFDGFESRPVEKKAEIKQEQELDIYWKLNGKGKAKLAIKLTKGKRITVILKDPKYLKELRGHLQTVAKFGLRKNFI